MIPLNGHVQIEPVTHEEFIASSKDTYEEIGTVIAVAEGITVVQPNDVVFFDSWVAARYPKGDGFYWLVKAEDLRAKKAPDEKVSAVIL